MLIQQQEENSDIDLESAAAALEDMVSGKTLKLISKECTVGRDLSNDISLAGDRSVSRFHFRIVISGADFLIEDCGSRNGTFLNGSPLAAARKLENGDIISAGMGRYRFSLRDADSRAERPEKPEALQELQMLRKSLRQSKTAETVDLEEKMFMENQEFQESGQESINSAEFCESQSSELAETAAAQKSTHRETEAYWLNNYSFPELNKLLKEKDRLQTIFDQTKHELDQLNGKLNMIELLTNSLLQGQGPELARSCRMALETLDWNCEAAANNPSELSLKKGAKVEAVLRVLVANGSPSQKDFEALVKQQALVWCQLNYEPKGIMLVQISPELALPERKALSGDFLENMRRKKVCVLETKQLLAIYRQVAFANQDKGFIRELLLNTCGLLPGFVLKRNTQESPAPNTLK